MTTGLENEEPASQQQGRRKGSRRLLSRILIALLALLVLPYLLTLIYIAVAPPTSALMLLRMAQGYMPSYHWVPMSEISPHLARGVIASEDQRFCLHSGIDWQAVQQVVSSDQARGASTITMQVAKNLFLWPGRSYLRKALELPLAYWIDLLWSKRRILEVYLNIVEFGPGIYGAEAAARHHFGKAAKDLSRREASLLVAVLPDPLGRNASKPGRTTSRIAALVERRMRAIGPYARCIGTAG